MPCTVLGTGKRAKNKNSLRTSFHDFHSLLGTGNKKKPLFYRSNVSVDLGRRKELNRAVI